MQTLGKGMTGRPLTQVVLHPHRVQAQLVRAFQVGHGVFDQHATVGGQAMAGQQQAQHAHIGLGPQFTKGPHALDGDDAFEARGQVQGGEHPLGVLGRRVGEQKLAARQALEGHAICCRHAQVGLQARQGVGLRQKVRGPDAVVALQSHQGGAIAAPVVHPQGIGLRARQAQVLFDVIGHRAVEPPEDRMPRIVQGVVEVEQPDGCRGTRARHGADPLSGCGSSCRKPDR